MILKLTEDNTEPEKSDQDVTNESKMFIYNTISLDFFCSYKEIFFYHKNYFDKDSLSTVRYIEGIFFCFNFSCFERIESFILWA